MAYFWPFICYARYDRLMADALKDFIALRDKPSRRIVGLMSGTSADGIDAALVDIEGYGESLKFSLIESSTIEFSHQLRRRIWALPDATTSAICEINFMLGEAFGRAVLSLLEKAKLPLESIDLIGSHGQTARHHPPGHSTRISSTLQLGEAAMIAELTKTPVISDFRVADMAAKGHGAPLIPLVDHLLFGDKNRVLINLGGIANLSVVGPDIGLEKIVAFDTGPANMAIDAIARSASSGHQTYDKDGKLAASGSIDSCLLAELLDHPYFKMPPPKSTGRAEFGRDFVYPLLDRYADRYADLAATLTALTVQSVAKALEQWVFSDYVIEEIIISGGGVHNPIIMQGLKDRLVDYPVFSSSERGLDPDAKEAIGFAILANESLFSQAGNVPAATGAKAKRVLGKISLFGDGL